MIGRRSLLGEVLILGSLALFVLMLGAATR